MNWTRPWLRKPENPRSSVRLHDLLLRASEVGAIMSDLHPIECPGKPQPRIHLDGTVVQGRPTPPPRLPCVVRVTGPSRCRSGLTGMGSA